MNGARDFNSDVNDPAYADFAAPPPKRIHGILYKTKVISRVYERLADA